MSCNITGILKNHIDYIITMSSVKGWEILGSEEWTVSTWIPCDGSREKLIWQGPNSDGDKGVRWFPKRQVFGCLWYPLVKMCARKGYWHQGHGLIDAHWGMTWLLNPNPPHTYFHISAWIIHKTIKRARNTKFCTACSLWYINTTLLKLPYPLVNDVEEISTVSTSSATSTQKLTVILVHCNNCVLYAIVCLINK